MPLVSVVMPVHNAAATLARAVTSIQGQTLTDWELLAVDDGSTDATCEMLIEFAAVDPRIRVLTIARSGIVAALNAGLAAASSPLIARMDADDESHPERLVAQVALLEARPDVGLAGCLVDFGGDRHVSEGYARHVDWLNALVEPEAIALNRFIESPFAHPSVMFRQKLVDDLGGYRDGDFPEDYELWLRWLDADVRMAKVPRPLVTWHDPPTRLSRTDVRYAPEAFYRLKARWVAEWLQRELPPQRKVWIWGAGRPTRKRADHLRAHGIEVAGYVDLDVKKTGRRVGGVPVVGPRDLPPTGESFFLGYVGTRGAREVTRADLARCGRMEGRDFLMCA